MKINRTSIIFYSISNDKDGNIVLKKTGEIQNKPVRGKDKLKYNKMVRVNNERFETD